MAVLSIITLVADMPVLAEKLRAMTGLNWQWWNVTTLVIGVCMVVYGWRPDLSHKQTGPKEAGNALDSPAETANSPNLLERLILTPLSYPVIWYRQLEAWSESGPESDPTYVVKRLIFAGAMLVLIFIMFIAFLFIVIPIIGVIYWYFDIFIDWLGDVLIASTYE